jgi:hypothetical protein
MSDFFRGAKAARGSCGVGSDPPWGGGTRDFFQRQREEVVASTTILHGAAMLVSKGQRRMWTKVVMSTYFYSCRHLLGLQVQRFVE